MNEVKDLTRSCFDRHPVWAWTADQQGFVPVEIEEDSPLPQDRGTLFIKAKLYPARGPALDGYIVGLGSVYAVGIFVGDGEYVFNLRLGDLAAAEASRLFAALGTAPFNLCPLRFTTGLSSVDGSALEGSFVIET